MPGITLHSGRIGGATKGVEASVGRDKIRICGSWSSSSMDAYVKPKDSGIAFNNAMINRWDWGHVFNHFFLSNLNSP